VSNHPYPDAPRLIAKARGGIATYSEPHPRGFSSLDRFFALWRALEYLGQQYEDRSRDLLDGLVEEESSADLVQTNERLRKLGRGFDALIQLGDSALTAYCDQDLPFEKREPAKHHLRSCIGALRQQRPGDRLSPSIRKAAVHVINSLRNAAVHTGAMSEAPTESPFPAGAALLDRLVCRLYGEVADYSLADVQNAIDYYAHRQATRTPSWDA
jgi:hypothetical protein